MGVVGIIFFIFVLLKFVEISFCHFIVNVGIFIYLFIIFLIFNVILLFHRVLVLVQMDL